MHLEIVGKDGEHFVPHHNTKYHPLDDAGVESNGEGRGKDDPADVLHRLAHRAPERSRCPYQFAPLPRRLDTEIEVYKDEEEGDDEVWDHIQHCLLQEDYCGCGNATLEEQFARIDLITEHHLTFLLPLFVLAPSGSVLESLFSLRESKDGKKYNGSRTEVELVVNVPSYPVDSGENVEEAYKPSKKFLFHNILVLKV